MCVWVCIIQICKCKCVLFKNILLRQEWRENGWVVLIYMCVCMCICMHVNKKYITAKFVSARLLNVCVYVWGDVEVHEKLSVLNYGKQANFNMAMNIFLLFVYSPISAAWLELCMTNLWDRRAKWARKLSNWEWEREAVKSVKYIGP